MLKNQTEAAEIYALLESMIALCEHMCTAVKGGDRSTAAHCGQTLGLAVQSLRTVSERIDREQPQITLHNFCRTIECSLLRVLSFRKGYAMKCEFELLPVLEELRLYFYYWGCVFPSPKKIERYRKEKLSELASNRYINRAEAEGKYKYDLSISIQAYNHLEDATKQCVESLLRHLPGNLKYELIFLNNGSSDGTKEFFERFRPTKQLDMPVNYGGRLALWRVYEGRYVLAISNDVFMLHHSIRNMLKCMDSDEKISFLVPQTPNISNLQALGIPCDCSEFTPEIEHYARENNQYQPNRHIQRARLCNPLSLFRSRDVFSNRGILFNGLFYTDDLTLAFPDDAISLRVNRMGKKNILQKDAFCYHMGQVTIKDDLAKQNENQVYQQGREAFFKEFGADPWGTGFCFDLYLMQAIQFSPKGHIDILGINSGLGDNPLQIKEAYKEYFGLTDAALYCVYEDDILGQSMAGIADVFKRIEGARDLKRIFPQLKFDHIIMEDPFRKRTEPEALIRLFQKRLKPDGEFALRLTNQQAEQLQKKEPEYRYCQGQSGVWVIGGCAGEKN